MHENLGKGANAFMGTLERWKQVKMPNHLNDARHRKYVRQLHSSFILMFRIKCQMGGQLWGPFSLKMEKIERIEN